MNAANDPVFNERGLLNAAIPSEAQIQQGMLPADGQNFEQWLESRVARFATRRYDWDALKFQADYDPKYRRAQMRYVGTGGTGVATDMNTVPAAHFTFSTMVIPAKHEGPSHIHYDVEEIFFMLRGTLKVICEKRDASGTVTDRWETVLKERDLISVPPGVYREEINIGDEDALMCVMLGSPTPIRPVYPPGSPLSQLKR
ncbi:cupin domain-containing protein [Variovorax sp. PCZ-1]|nr:cupin domain-containing protein [Variovorax sp. PCZ-1]